MSKAVLEFHLNPHSLFLPVKLIPLFLVSDLVILPELPKSLIQVMLLDSFLHLHYGIHRHTMWGRKPPADLNHVDSLLCVFILYHAQC